MFFVGIRVIGKVRKTQHQNPEFGRTQGEIIKNNLQKKYISIQQAMKLRKPYLQFEMIEDWGCSDCHDRAPPFSLYDL
jgi:hypothetical protein